MAVSERQFPVAQSLREAGVHGYCIQNVALIIAAVSYFLMPVDAIPDFILSVGLVDDVALLIWTFKTVKDEIDKFRRWETPSISQVPEVEQGQLIEGEWVQCDLEQGPQEGTGAEKTT